jgi:hypothetical protein
MKKSTLAALAALVMVCVVACAGCNASQAAQRAQSVIAAVLNIAQAEEAALPPSDAAVLTPWVSAGETLNGQLSSCIAGATAAGSKKSAFLACFNTFAQGLFSPTELSQLRLLSPGTQKKVQLWVTAISVGLNVAIPAFGGTEVTPPTLGGAPSAAELRGFARRIGVAYGY